MAAAVDNVIGKVTSQYATLSQHINKCCHHLQNLSHEWG
jgi:hypothetical protein